MLIVILTYFQAHLFHIGKHKQSPTALFNIVAQAHLEGRKNKKRSKYSHPKFGVKKTCTHHFQTVTNLRQKIKENQTNP